MQTVERQGDTGQVGEKKGSGLDRVAEAERLLLVVEAEVVDALHQLRDLDVVRRPLDDLGVVAALELEAGRQNHEDSSQHHVRSFVEEVVVQLRRVQQDLKVDQIKD